MNAYVIKTRPEFITMVKGETADDALINFATTMDTDMNLYFSAMDFSSYIDYDRKPVQAFFAVCEALEKYSDHGKRVWCDGERILCQTEIMANAISDMFVDCGLTYVNTGYYDPEEDKRNNCVDDHTGYWYVDID